MTPSTATDRTERPLGNRAGATPRRPWAPTSLTVMLTLLVAGVLWLQPGMGPEEPEVRSVATVSAPDEATDGAIWPVDPAVTADLREFLDEHAAERGMKGLPPRPAEDFRRGVALGLYSREVEYDYGGLIEEIAAHEAGWVSLFFNMYQQDVRAVEMGPLTTVAQQEAMLRRTIRQAHGAGLKALVFPLVLLREAGEREWRGSMGPADVDEWFANYSAHIVRLARLAEAEGAEGFCVGSEFSSLEYLEAKWRGLIAEVREVYSGEIVYSANWDHYQAVNYWDAVDAIGLSGYYELTKSNEPTVEELAAKWAAIREEIVAWRESESLAAPIVFTEIGYANQDGTAIYPWNYTRRGAPDPGEQADAYEAFIRAWHGEPAFGGAFFYNWFGFDTLEDTGYSPRGKPAAAMMDAWYGWIEKN